MFNINNNPIASFAKKETDFDVRIQSAKENQKTVSDFVKTIGTKSVKTLSVKDAKKFLNQEAENGQFQIITPDPDSTAFVSETFTSDEDTDLAYNTNQRFSDDFTLLNLLSVIDSSNDKFQSFEYPNILSHEIIKVKDQNSGLKNTNESSLNPFLIFNLRKDYYEKIQSSNAYSYFIYSQNSKNIRENYVEELSQNNNLIKNTYSNLKDIFEIRDKIKVENNFGNKLVDFYLNESSSTTLGKVASLILSNEDIDFIDITSNSKSRNNNISRFTYNNIKEQFTYFNDQEAVLNKVLNLKLSSANISESDYIKNASNNLTLINTDRFIGQSILNTSVSMNGLYKDSISYDYWNEVNGDQFSEINNLIDGEVFFKIPIIKLDSVLSIHTQSNLIFNNFNNDDLYALNNDNNVFDLSGIDTRFNSLNFLKKDALGSFKSPPNSSTFIFFNKSMYLENNFNMFSKIFSRVGGESKPTIVEKEKFINNNQNNIQSFAEFYFNPFSVLNALVYKDSVTTNNANSLGNIFSSYFTDIGFLRHTLLQNKEILRKNKDNNEDFQVNSAREILSASKFLYFAGKNAGFDFSKTTRNIDGSLNLGKNTYVPIDVKYILLDNKENIETDDESVLNRYLRKPLNPIDLTITKGSFREYYSENSLYSGFSSLNSNLKNSINTFSPISFEEEDRNKRDLGFRRHIIDVFKGKNKFLKNSFVFNFIKNNSNINSNNLKIKKGFALIKNTQKNISIDDIDQKFINFRQDLTSEDEFLNSRIIASSSSHNPNVTNKEDISLVTDRFKDRSLNSEKSWPEVCFSLRKNLYELKSKKIKLDQDNNFLNYLEDFKNKAKKIRKIDENSAFLSLLYSKDPEKSIDSEEESDFTFTDENGDLYKKFDFSKSVGEIKDSVEYILRSEDQNINTFPITSEEIKRFMSLYYTNSEFKSSYTYFLSSYRNVLRSIKSNIYHNSITEDSRKKLCYDKLLADAVANNDSKDLQIFLILSAIINYKNITNIEDNFEVVNEKTNLSYQKYLENIYSFKNIQRQKSFTLRTVDFPDTQLSTFPTDRGISKSTEELNTSLGGFIYLNHNFNLGVMPGITYTLGFPFLNSYYNHNVTNKSTDCLVIEVQDGKHLIASKDKYIKSNDENPDSPPTQEALYEFSYSNFYNYDTYIDSSQRSLGESTVINNTAFNIVENKVSLFNIVRSDKGVSSEVGRYKFNKNTNYRSKLEDLTYNFTINQERDIENNILSKNEYYTVLGIKFKDFGIYNIDNQPDFKKYINKSIIEFLKFLDNDFDENVQNIQSIEDALTYTKTFENTLDNIFNLLKFPCDLYSTIFDLIQETSLLSNIDKYLDSTINQEDKDFDLNHRWNIESYDIFKFEEVVNDDSKFKFENKVKSEEDMSEAFYLKLHADIGQIQKTLSNSDIMEIMSIDTLSSYFHEFDKFRNQNNSFLNLQNKVDSLESELENVDITSIISDECLLNTVSKNLNNYFYYQNTEYFKINQKINQNLNVDLKNIFEDILRLNTEGDELNSSFFGTLIKKERDLTNLSFQGSYLTQLNNEKYDIIRMGIDYNVANFLLNNKILKIKIHISNHKFPNIYIPPIYKFYTPVLTEITSSHMSILESQSEGVFVDDFIGVFDFNSKDLKERYSVASLAEAVELIQNILTNVNSERIFRNESNLIDLSSQSNERNALKIVIDAIDSCAIKYSNYRSQKFIDENNIKDLGENNFVISETSRGKFSAMTQKDFEETFSESYDEAIDDLSSDFDSFNKVDVIEKQAHYVEFFNAITEYVDEDKVRNSFVKNRFYDIFSILISREDIKNRISDLYQEGEAILDLIKQEDFFDSFTYTIEAEVV